MPIPQHSPGSTTTWANPNGDLFSTQREVYFDETMAGQAGIYTLTVTDGNGCAQTDSQNIEVISFSLDTQSNPPDSEACEGANLVIKAITDAESATYSWQGPGGSASKLDSISFANALPGQSGIYHVTVTDANGCSQTASDTITIHRLPLAVIDSMPETGIVCEGEQLKFCARPDAQIVAYGWNGPDGFSSSGRCVDFASSTQSQSGTYYFDSDRCKRMRK